MNAFLGDTCMYDGVPTAMLFVDLPISCQILANAFLRHGDVSPKMEVELHLPFSTEF